MEFGLVGAMALSYLVQVRGVFPGGFSVGLTVARLGVAAGPTRPGVVERPSRLTEVLPVEARSDAEIAVELARLQAVKGMLAAYEASLVMGAGRAPPGRGRGGAVPGAGDR